MKTIDIAQIIVCTLLVSPHVVWAQADVSSNSPPLVKGIYGLTSGGQTDVPSEILNHPDVAGVSVRTDWRRVEPSEGVYDWSSLDHKISQAANAGKAVLLQVTPGEDSPEWIYDAGVEAFQYIDPNSYHDTFCQSVRIPVPWDDVYLTKWTNFIAALGQQYGQNQHIKIVRASGGSNAHSSDMHLPDNDVKLITKTQPDGSIIISCMRSDDVVNWNAIGYTPEKINNAWKTILDAYAKAFPNAWLDVAVGRVNINDKQNKGMTVANGVSTYGYTEWGQRFMISLNNLSAVLPKPPPPVDDVRELLVWSYHPQIMLQFLWATTNDSTCRNNDNICDYDRNGVKDATDQYLIFQDAMQTGMLYQPQVIEVYRDDMANPAFQPILASAAKQIGSPLIQKIASLDITSSSTTITWTTDESADSQVAFGRSPCPCSLTTPMDSALVTSHTVSLSRLMPNTLYYYNVLSKDVNGNRAISATHTFTTEPAYPHPTTTTTTKTSAITTSTASILTTTTTLTTPTPTPLPPGNSVASGCFIATAAYGSYLDPHVQVLRAFRDDVLLKSSWGKAFVDVYYTWSPPIARFISDRSVLRVGTRLALTPVVFAVEKPGLAGGTLIIGMAIFGAWVSRLRKDKTYIRLRGIR